MKDNTRLDRLKMSFEEFTPQMLDLYRPWTHKQPILIDIDRIESMRSVQLAMLKLMTFIAENYSEVSHLLPHDEKAKQFLNKLQGIKFQEGTFRTDFVVDENNEMRLIEVTCRYPLNGYFRSPAMNQLCSENGIADSENLSLEEIQKPVLEKFHQWMGDERRFCLVQGKDNRGNESLHLPRILENANIDVLHITLDQWRCDWQKYVSGSAIMAELTFEEWLSLPIDVVKAMLKQPLLNDPRLVFTVHDKSFFALVNEYKILKQALTESEIHILEQFFAETYLPNSYPDKWLEAKDNKSQWMLKPRKLGRSVNIIAGSLTSTDDWLEAIRTAPDNEMILQRWYQSKKISGSISDQEYHDYFAGTLLYWGCDFFGPGMFRMSSYPISNIVDDRKATFIVDFEHNELTHPHLNWL